MIMLPLFVYLVFVNVLMVEVTQTGTYLNNFVYMKRYAYAGERKFESLLALRQLKPLDIQTLIS